MQIPQTHDSLAQETIYLKPPYYPKSLTPMIRKDQGLQKGNICFTTTDSVSAVTVKHAMKHLKTM